jgi:hypothetical protein
MNQTPKLISLTFLVGASLFGCQTVKGQSHAKRYVARPDLARNIVWRASGTDSQGRSFFPNMGKITSITLITEEGKHNIKIPSEVEVKFLFTGAMVFGRVQKGVPPALHYSMPGDPKRPLVKIWLTGVKDVKQPLTTTKCELDYVQGHLTLDLRKSVRIRN